MRDLRLSSSLRYFLLSRYFWAVALNSGFWRSERSGYEVLRLVLVWDGEDMD